jgi:hypothetical protein
MRPGDLRALLGILSPEMVILTPGQELPAGRKALLLLMTTHEVRWWNQQKADGKISSEALREWDRNGQQAALILLHEATSIR